MAIRRKMILIKSSLLHIQGIYQRLDFHIHLDMSNQWYVTLTATMIVLPMPSSLDNKEIYIFYL